MINFEPSGIPEPLNEPGEPREFQPSPAAGCGLVAIAFVLWAVGLLVIQISFMWFKGWEYHIGLDLAIALFVYTFIFSYSVWSLLKLRNPISEIGLALTSRTVPDYFYGTALGALGVGAAVLVIMVGGEVSVSHNQAIPHSLSQTLGPFSWPVAIIMFAIYAGEEEVFTRGLIYPILRKSVGICWAVLLSSLLFSSLHLANPGFSVTAYIDILLAGILLALCRELTGNLWFAWGVHFGWNFALIAAGIPVSGMFPQLSPHNFQIVLHGPGWLTGAGFGPEGGLSGIIADLFMIAVTLMLIHLKNKKLALPVSEASR